MSLLGLILVLALVILGVAISRQPDVFRVARVADINATPDKIFPHVNDLHKWEAWSPWAKLDPNSKSTFEGASAGTGAVMRWEGNNKVGAGSMTIIESRPNEFIKFRLDFLKPMKATNLAEFTFTPSSGKTTVTWSMSGDNNFISKTMSLVMNCEKMIGGQFEQGLASLRTIAEKP